jgi:hypothetical protein
MSNKVTSRSYNYFFKFSYFILLRNRFFQQCQKLQSLLKTTQGILGVNTCIVVAIRENAFWKFCKIIFCNKYCVTIWKKVLMEIKLLPHDVVPLMLSFCSWWMLILKFLYIIIPPTTNTNCIKISNRYQVLNTLGGTWVFWQNNNHYKRFCIWMKKVSTELCWSRLLIWIWKFG